MSKTYEMCVDDTVRSIEVKMLRKGKLITSPPVSAQLKIITGSTVIMTKTLINNGDSWTYDFLDADFSTLVPGVYKLKVLGTWAGPEYGTFPTKGYGSLIVYSKT